MTKSWLATQDGRTRIPHLEAHGQEVPIDENFTVAGESLAFPGDTSNGASAKNIINCRCTQTYRVVTDAEGE